MSDDRKLEKEAKRRAKIEQVYRRGRTRFILTRGVFGYGLWMLVCVTVINRITRSNGQFHFRPISLSGILINLVIWPLAGYLFGSYMWGQFTSTHMGSSSTPQA